MVLKKFNIKKFFTILFVLVFTATLAVPAGAATYKSSRAGYCYSRQALYGKPYIFEIAWNVSDKTAKEYGSKKISLSDNVSMTVWYTDGLKKDMSDKDVTAALADVLNRIRTDSAELSKPIVLNIKNVGNVSAETLTKQYYKTENIMFYAAVLPFANSKTQRAYVQKAYVDDSAALFSVSLDTLGSKGIAKRYLSKAYKDNHIAFFSICLDKLEDVLNVKDFGALVNTYTEKAYADNSVAFFAVLADRMDRDTVAAWLERANNDNKFVFASICGYCDGSDDYWDDFDDA